MARRLYSRRLFVQRRREAAHPVQIKAFYSYAQKQSGESLNLTCYIVGETNSTDIQIRWMKDEEAIATTNGSNKLFLQLETSDSSHTGVYTCEVVMDGMTLQANANVTVTCKSINIDDAVWL